jgi:hypothetical protein
MGRRWLAAVAAALVMAKVAQVVVPAAETSPAPIAGTVGSRPFRDKFGVVGLEQQPASAGRDQLRRATFVLAEVPTAAVKTGSPWRCLCRAGREAHRRAGLYLPAGGSPAFASFRATIFAVDGNRALGAYHCAPVSTARLDRPDAPLTASRAELGFRMHSPPAVSLRCDARPSRSAPDAVHSQITDRQGRVRADSPLEESGFEPLVPLTPKRGRCRFASK